MKDEADLVGLVGIKNRSLLDRNIVRKRSLYLDLAVRAGKGRPHARLPYEPIRKSADRVGIEIIAEPVLFEKGFDALVRHAFLRCLGVCPDEAVQHVVHALGMSRGG